MLFTVKATTRLPFFAAARAAAVLLTLTVLAYCPNTYAQDLILRFRNEPTFAVNSNLGAVSKISQHSSKEILFHRNATAIEAPDTLALSNPCDEMYAAYGDELELCEENQTVRTTLTPSDPSFSAQWWLEDNLSMTDHDIDASAAWDVSTGSDEVVVAVLDTGIDHNHSDLAANIWTNPLEIPGNGVDDDQNGYIDDIHGANTITQSGNSADDNGHGTHVAGIIGARGSNGVGGSGVNWQVKIVALKFLGSGGSGTVFDAVQAIDYAIALKQRGVNIVALNNSWDGANYSQSLSDAIQRARDAGMLFLVAAGNDGANNDQVSNYPANYTHDNVITVASTDKQGHLSFFSNHGSHVHIAAPGEAIYSTTPGNHYALFSGTSMATPVVTGAAALLKAIHPELNFLEIKNQILGTAVPYQNLSGVVTSGSIINLGRMATGDTNPITPIPGTPDQPEETPSVGWIDHSLKAGQSLTVILTAPGYSSGKAKLRYGNFTCDLDSVTISSSNTILSVKIPKKLYGHIAFMLTDQGDDLVDAASINVKKNGHAKSPVSVSKASSALKSKWCAAMQLAVEQL